MLIEYCGSEFDIPDILIEKFSKDFDCLPGSGQRDSIYQLRDSVYGIIDLVAEEPDLLDEYEYLQDFIRALAMQQALKQHGILYDA